MVIAVLKKHSVLLILPIVYAFFCIHISNKSQNGFIRTVDPEYIHLMSSINLAEGNISIQSIESPATPLYVLGAITSKVTCWVSSSDSLKDDFISNPEKYIDVLRMVLLPRDVKNNAQKFAYYFLCVIFTLTKPVLL